MRGPDQPDGGIRGSARRTVIIAILAVLSVLALTLALWPRPLTGPAAGSALADPAPGPSTTTTAAAPSLVSSDPATPPPTPQVPITEATPEAPHSAPTRLVMPRLGLDQPILPVGVRSDGQMALPDHPTDFGWFAGGAAPGERSGAAVIGGHVDSVKYGVGPLARLSSARQGDRLDISLSDGRVLGFVVQDIQLLPRRTLPVDQLFRIDGPPVVRLVTCGGPYEAGSGYADNVVVTATPVPSP
jgi:hypothetical protein